MITRAYFLSLFDGENSVNELENKSSEIVKKSKIANVAMQSANESQNMREKTESVQKKISRSAKKSSNATRRSRIERFFNASKTQKASATQIANDANTNKLLIKNSKRHLISEQFYFITRTAKKKVEFYSVSCVVVVARVEH